MQEERRVQLVQRDQGFHVFRLRIGVGAHGPHKLWSLDRHPKRNQVQQHVCSLEAQLELRNTAASSFHDIRLVLPVSDEFWADCVEVFPARPEDVYVVFAGDTCGHKFLDPFKRIGKAHEVTRGLFCEHITRLC